MKARVRVPIQRNEPSTGGIDRENRGRIVERPFGQGGHGVIEDDHDFVRFPRRGRRAPRARMNDGRERPGFPLTAAPASREGAFRRQAAGARKARADEDETGDAQADFIPWRFLHLEVDFMLTNNPSNCKDAPSEKKPRPPGRGRGGRTFREDQASASREARRSFQKFSTEAISTRSSGECGYWSVGPREIMSMPGNFSRSGRIPARRGWP